ncbi:hypothetical protein BV898_02172 [Hypsibius exemplaris]|uniref:Uncharacterized protein n=1 Tax=Hypsibius exemplaris TaxID=2072580 RepID=A0A1W0X8W2_HYPEX|nr:hypothetical protein BV898_02172 [Hypsibius exemplaris]
MVFFSEWRPLGHNFLLSRGVVDQQNTPPTRRATAAAGRSGNSTGYLEKRQQHRILGEAATAQDAGIRGLSREFLAILLQHLDFITQ